MLNLFNNIHEDNKIVKIILKNDGIIYGGLVRDLINGKYNYTKTYNVKAFVPIIYKSIFERELYKYIDTIINYSKGIKSNDFYEYNLKSNKYNVKKLFVYFVTDILFQTKEGYIKNIENYILLNVNTIGFTRKGFQLLHKDEIEKPFPFLDLVKHIENKEFKAALAHHNDIIKHFPDESEAWSDRAYIKLELNDWNQIIIL